MLKEPDLDPEERAEILEANSALQAVADAALISRALGFPVLPWTLADWPLDLLEAARALGRKWIGPMLSHGR